MRDILENLNEKQREAVGGNLEDNILCNSIAGSGKTHVLTNRVAYLIKKGVNPNEILLLTFTNQAAKEMTDRVNKILETDTEIQSGTFHSIGWKYSKKYGEELYGINPEEWDIASNSDKDKAWFKSLSAFKKEKYTNATVKDLKNMYSVYCNLNYFYKPRKNIVINEDNFKTIMNLYKIHLSIWKKVDFHSMLEGFDSLLNNDKALKDIRSKIKYVLVDEYQDVNKTQESIVEKISGKKRVFAVGDPLQSIYGFRGSNVNYILDFKDKYDAKEIILEDNYRSNKEILKLAESFVSKTYKGFEDFRMKPFLKDSGKVNIKELGENETTELDYLMNEIERLRKKGVKNKDICILIRQKPKIIDMLKSSLRNKGIKYKIVPSRSFLDNEYVEVLTDIILVLDKGYKNNFYNLCRWFNLYDERVLNIVYNMYKNKELNKDITISEIDNEKIEDMLLMIEDLEKVFNKNNIYDLIYRFLNTYYFKRKEKEEAYRFARWSIKEKGHSFLSKKDLDVELMSLSDGQVYAIKDAVKDKWSKRLELFSRMFKGKNIWDFYEIIFEESNNEENKEDLLTISTIHSSKGLEWDYVFIPYFNQDFYPNFFEDKNDRPIEEVIEEVNEEVNEKVNEEKRLMYVAITRAKKELTITSSMSDKSLIKPMKEL